ncbi:unnamed protein product [Arctogadus glacialis]
MDNVNGAKECQRESLDGTETKVMDPLQSRATPWKSGLTTAGYRHRPIVFKALGWKDKVAFMARRNKLRGPDRGMLQSNLKVTEEFLNKKTKLPQ